MKYFLIFLIVVFLIWFYFVSAQIADPVLINLNDQLVTQEQYNVIKADLIDRVRNNTLRDYKDVKTWIEIFVRECGNKQVTVNGKVTLQGLNSVLEKGC